MSQKIKSRAFHKMSDQCATMKSINGKVVIRLKIATYIKYIP